MDANHLPSSDEVLVKKAAVDPEFRKLLMEKRAESAATIGLSLDPAEAAMLNTVPAEQLADPDSLFIEINGLKVHYKRAGQGQPVLLLLHGFGSSTFWRVRLGDIDLACDSTEGTLTGETFDGQAIEGSDAVRMISQASK